MESCLPPPSEGAGVVRNMGHRSTPAHNSTLADPVRLIGGILATVHYTSIQMTRRHGKSERSVKRLLKTDPTICIIKTPFGIYYTHSHWFAQLCKLPWLVKVAQRVARVADEFTVIISNKEFYVYRTRRGPVEPSLPTFAGQVDEAWKYKCESRSLSPVERQEQAMRDYALFCVLEAV